MGTGAITSHLDVASLVLYGFWIFFAGLVYYLVLENHREGYPMDAGPNARSKVTGWPIPRQKIYKLNDGTEVAIPNPARMDWPVDLKAVPTSGSPGAAFEPTGNPMLDGVGPGAYALRADVPEYTTEGTPKIFPLRNAPEYDVAMQSRDPRGLPIVGDDGEVGGTVVDLWLDGPESLFRYLEVAVPVAGGTRNVLVPFNCVRVKADHVKVKAILGNQFAHIPLTKRPDSVTLLEEEKIFGYFGGGTLYAEPRRVEPLL
jgi:photosynthetic reaction center H subunit